MIAGLQHTLLTLRKRWNAACHYKKPTLRQPSSECGNRVTISTESGDGRHNDVKRELSGIFHAVTGAGGRLKTGQIMDVGAEGIDVYNTLLATMGVAGRLGPDTRQVRPVDSIRA